jgi:cell division protein ZapA
MKQIEVQIMGQSYLLGCPDGGEPQLRDAVERVDAAMCKIRDAGKVKARDRIAVLASLNLAFDLAAQQAVAAAAPPQRPACHDRARRSRCQGRPAHSKARSGPGRRWSFALNEHHGLIRSVKSELSAVRVGLNISLFQCSPEPGLVHRSTGVIISRQMNPKSCCPRPPEPWFRMRVRRPLADTFFHWHGPQHTLLGAVALSEDLQRDRSPRPPPDS